MKLQEIFDQLSAGEFSQLSIGGEAAGVINDNNAERVLNHVNLGLIDLYSRFTLKEGRLTLALQPDQTTYPLLSSFAVNARHSREAVRYIIDTSVNKFRDDIIKVERVLDADGAELPLNDLSDTTSVFTPSTLVLRVPSDLIDTSETLELVYRAYPDKLSNECCRDACGSEVELPRSHMLALLYFIASRVHNPIGMTGEFNAGNNYAAKYEMACQQLEGKGLQVDQGQQNTRLYRNGWV